VPAAPLEPGQVSLPSAGVALLRGLCPVCRKGRIFAGRWRMNATCPVCALEFEREPGYFVGAMYISYLLAVPLIAVAAFVIQLLVPGWPLYLVVLVGGAAILPLVPALFRYSRVLWIHFDRLIDPSK
jgi:uncharacterized protein (DUF983 family)